MPDTPLVSKPALRDPWARRPVPLDGWLERMGVPPLLMAVLATFGMFVFFAILSFAVLVVLLLMQGASLAEIQDGGRVAELISANAVGQWLGLLAPSLLLAWLSSSRAGGFLRLRHADASLMGLSVLGLLTFQPVVLWLQSLNARLPLPEWMHEMSAASTELLEQVLASDLGLGFYLVMLAVTPAFCEEVLFRGYVQRQVERAFSPFWSILVVGVTFGLYHLQPTNVLPLSALGCYLAWLTWRTGSLWPAIVVHFVNNALAVMAALYAEEALSINPEKLETMVVPITVLVPAALLFAGLVAMLDRRARRLRPHT